MKNKFLFVLIASMGAMMIMAGCSEYEKDASYDTDLYGSYSTSMEAPDVPYSFNETYNFNIDDTYDYIVNEVIYEETTRDTNKSGKILSVKKLSEDITEITIDQEIIDSSTSEKTYETLYKYRNMLGLVNETEVPKGKTFELHLDTGAWYDKDGQYHLCTDSETCDCNENYPHYVRQGNIIYYESMDEEHKNYYTIAAYIIDNGLFFLIHIKMNDHLNSLLNLLIRQIIAFLKIHTWLTSLYEIDIIWIKYYYR